MPIIANQILQSVLVSFLNRQTLGKLGMSLFLLGMASPYLHAQTGRTDSASRTTAYRSSLAQESLRTEIHKLSDELVVLIGELRANDLPDAGFATLYKAIQQLGEIKQENIDQVVKALQAAGFEEETSARLKLLLTAHENQQGIESRLRAMAGELGAQQRIASMPIRIRAMLERQIGVIAQTKAVSASPKTNAAGEQLARTGQNAITEELTQILAQGNEHLETIKNARLQESLKAALAWSQSNRLADHTRSASAELEKKQWANALTAQEATRDGLARLLHMLQVDTPASQRLESLRRDADRLASEQQKLSEMARQESADRQNLAEKQERLSLQTQALQKELEQLDAKASQMTSDAADLMNESVSELKADKADPKLTADKQQKAAEALQQAVEQVAQQIASLPQAPGSLAESAEKIRELQQETAAAQAQQNALASQTAPDERLQERLAEQVAALQQQASNVSPQAAAELGAAHSEMSRETPTQATAQAAADALADAAKTLEKQLQSTLAALEQQKNLENLAQQVAEAMQTAGQAEKNINQDATAQATNDLKAASDAAREAQKNAGQQQNAQAEKSLAEAAAQLSEARLKAAQGQGEPAKERIDAAKQSLAQVQESIQSALEQLARDQGIPSQHQSSVAQNHQFEKGGHGEHSGRLGNSPHLTDLSLLPEVKLDEHDRKAISVFQDQPAPESYQTLIRQYYRNLTQ
jgi:hypothetical protein